jgi:hypothetical protein
MREALVLVLEGGSQEEGQQAAAGRFSNSVVPVLKAGTSARRAALVPGCRALKGLVVNVVFDGYRQVASRRPASAGCACRNLSQFS